MQHARTISRGAASYFTEIRRFPMLKTEEEKMLIARWREGDGGAAHQLLASHLRLVAKIVRSYRGYSLLISELISEGNIGLIQTLKQFDPDAVRQLWQIKGARPSGGSTRCLSLSRRPIRFTGCKKEADALAHEGRHLLSESLRILSQQGPHQHRKQNKIHEDLRRGETSLRAERPFLRTRKQVGRLVQQPRHGTGCSGFARPRGHCG